MGGILHTVNDMHNSTYTLKDLFRVDTVCLNCKSEMSNQKPRWFIHACQWFGDPNK